MHSGRYAPSKDNMKRLITKVRKTPEYLQWKESILARDVVSYPKVPKGTQVHHLVNISELIKLYRIFSVEGAKKCKELWKADGIALTRGEHFILTRLGFYKYPSPGFMVLLREKVKKLEIRTTRIGDKRI